MKNVVAIYVLPQPCCSNDTMFYRVRLYIGTCICSLHLSIFVRTWTSSASQTVEFSEAPCHMYDIVPKLA